MWRLTISSENAAFGVRYEPTTEKELVDVIRFLPVDSRMFNFIDLGCGKGRTLLVAARLGFKAVIGVEFAIELVNIARRNLIKRNVVNGSVLHADAAHFIFPSADSVVYLYNPFTEEVMQRVVENLRTVAARKLYILYKRPECADVLDSCGFLERLASPPDAQHIHVWTSSDRNRVSTPSPGSYGDASRAAMKS